MTVGIDFNDDLCFHVHSFQDKDGALKPHELDNLFATSPGNLWLDSGFPDCTTTNDQQAVTLQGFLALWRYDG